MKRTEIVRKTKFIAKRVLVMSLFKLMFLVVLETFTALALSLVFSALAERIAPGAVIEIGPFAIHVVAVLSTLAANLLLLPLTLGLTEYLLKLVRRRETRVSDIFLWFSDGEKLKRVLSYFAYVAALSLITIPLSTVPGQYLLATANELLEDLGARAVSDPTMLTLNWSLVNWPAVIGSAVAMLVCELAKIRLFATPYCFLDVPGHSAFTAAMASWKLTKGHMLTYIWLTVSFIGWYMAAALTGFLILMFVLPYVQLSTVILAEYIRADALLKRAQTDEVPTETEEEA